jgi:hypothetical protein
MMRLKNIALVLYCFSFLATSVVSGTDVNNVDDEKLFPAEKILNSRTILAKKKEMVAGFSLANRDESQHRVDNHESTPVETAADTLDAALMKTWQATYPTLSKQHKTEQREHQFCILR